jgi:hypothetical protein
MNNYYDKIVNKNMEIENNNETNNDKMEIDDIYILENQISNLKLNNYQSYNYNNIPNYNNIKYCCSSGNYYDDKSMINFFRYNNLNTVCPHYYFCERCILNKIRYMRKNNQYLFQCDKCKIKYECFTPTTYLQNI